MGQSSPRTNKSCIGHSAFLRVSRIASVSPTKHAPYCCIDCCADSPHHPKNDGQDGSNQNDADITDSNRIDDDRNDGDRFGRDRLHSDEDDNGQNDQRTSNDKL